jgi:hypothetical protein
MKNLKKNMVRHLPINQLKKICWGKLRQSFYLRLCDLSRLVIRRRSKKLGLPCRLGIDGDRDDRDDLERFDALLDELLDRLLRLDELLDPDE